MPLNPKPQTPNIKPQTPNPKPLTPNPKPPRSVSKGFLLYFGWLAYSALCYVILPGPIGYGQVTPANYKLPCVKPQTLNPKP